MKSGIVKSGSANIYYEISGSTEKEVLVFLHGNGKSMEVFRRLIPMFENDYCVLAIDSRGHGESEFGKAELSLGTMTIDLETVLEELNIKRVNVLGFGDGANIALLFAIKCSDMVNKLIIVGGNYNFSGYSFFNRIMLRIAYYCSKISGVFDAHNRLNKEYFALIVKEPRLKKSSLRAIKAKTLVLAATNDMITKSHSKAMADAILDAKLKIVKGDRFWMFKESDKAYKLIDEFLKA